MKKFLVMAFMAVMALGASAQVYLGGSIGYAHKTIDVADEGETFEVKSDAFTIAPEIGYNLSEKWAVGAGLEYTWLKDAYNHFSINPYARYSYFRTDNNLVQLFIDGGFNIGYMKPDGGDSECTWGIGLTPGIALNLTEKFSLVAHVGFLGYKDEKAAGKTYGLNLDGNDLSFGFYYNF